MQLAFTGAGVAGEDIENELRAVDDAHVDDLFQVALLGGGEVMIEQKKIGRDRSCGPGNFFQFTFADERGGVGFVSVLQEVADDLSPGAVRQGAKFFERFFGAETSARASL